MAGQVPIHTSILELSTHSSRKEKAHSLAIANPHLKQIKAAKKQINSELLVLN
jgi:hypothetical protein